MNLLIIDNYDSFTFNLKHICEPYVTNVDVFRNDDFNLDIVDEYDKIIISPGPGLPKEAGLTMDLIKRFYKNKDILGVCLGAQAIAVFFGYKLYNLQNVMHGKKSDIIVLRSEMSLYKNIPSIIKVGRYHSWAINIDNEKHFLISSKDLNNVLMSFHHKKYKLTGIQYHPESIMTEYGSILLKNWLFH